MAVGLIGTVLPVFPGTIIILAAAVIHRMMLGPEKSIGWWNDRRSCAVDAGLVRAGFSSGYFGARHFGATKWGMFGALLGAIIGIFFGIAGLFVGPVIGAIAGEFIAGKRMINAGRAGWGSLLGESRRNDWQTCYRAGDDHDFLHELCHPRFESESLIRQPRRSLCKAELCTLFAFSGSSPGCDKLFADGR